MEQKSLNNEHDSIDFKSAHKILQDLRKEIDQIDNDLIDLIQKRTYLANDIVLSKLALNMDIFDPKREKLIHEKIEKVSIEKKLNNNTKNSILEIMNILINLSKEEQKEIINDND